MEGTASSGQMCPHTWTDGRTDTGCGWERQRLRYIPVTASQNHRITESQNSRGWKGPLWVI